MTETERKTRLWQRVTSYATDTTKDLGMVCAAAGIIEPMLKPGETFGFGNYLSIAIAFAFIVIGAFLAPHGAD